MEPSRVCALSGAPFSTSGSMMLRNVWQRGQCPRLTMGAVSRRCTMDGRTSIVGRERRESSGHGERKRTPDAAQCSGVHMFLSVAEGSAP